MAHRGYWLAGPALLVLVWLALHPAQPILPLDDLYTHLCVTRHLVNGDGFLNDVVYPLSLTFECAASVPQPLIHRQPGYPLLLTIPYLAAGGDPAGTIDAVRIMQVVLLGLIAGLGVFQFRRRGAGMAIGGWLVFLALNPLLAYAINWGQVEVVVALVVLLLWFRLRPDADSAPATEARYPLSLRQRIAIAGGDGLLAGLLTSLRADLIWLPIFWWLVMRRRLGFRQAIMTVVVWMVIAAPWCIRNIRVTGTPWFSLQAHAEHLKDTSIRPNYSIYRSLSPETVLESLRKHPEPLARKTARGIDFFATNLGRTLPWLVWALWPILLWIQVRTCGSRAGPDFLPPAVALSTLALLMIQYAFFSHTIRHLAILLPVLIWEFCLAMPVALASPLRARRPIMRGIVPGLVVLAICLLPRQRLPGWENTVRWAAAVQPDVTGLVEQADELPPGPVFTDNAAVLWYTGRAGVWSPLNQKIESRIRRTIPGMQNAPGLYLLAIE